MRLTLSLSPSEVRLMEELFRQLESLDSVTKVLQDDKTAIDDVRALFDGIIEAFAENFNRLSTSSSIVHCLVFKDAIVKLKLHITGAISREQRNITSFLVHEVSCESDNENDELSFAHRPLRKQKIIAQESALDCMDSHFLVPASNVCKMFFLKLAMF